LMKVRLRRTFIKTNFGVCSAEGAANTKIGFVIAYRFAFALKAMWAWIQDSSPASYNLSGLIH
jgi:hypothetical protein